MEDGRWKSVRSEATCRSSWLYHLPSAIYHSSLSLRGAAFDAGADRGDGAADVVELFADAFELLAFGADEAAVGRNAFTDPVGAAADLGVELRVQRLGELLADGGDLRRHLVLRLLPLGGQDEEADGREHRRHDDPGDVGGRGR